MDKVLLDFFKDVLDDDLILRIIEMDENGLNDIEILSKIMESHKEDSDD